MSGSKFCAYVAQMDEARREIAIENQFLQGNIPSFLRRLKPVRAQYENSDGSRTTALFFVTPDYLAIGSDDDFVRIPMNRNTATRIAARFGFVLPTPKMVDAIYDQSDFRFTPQPMPPGSRMRSTAYFQTHHQKIEDQRRAARVPLGNLVSGHKKDVVITNRLNRQPNRIAIYGWHRTGGKPIQPLSCVHGAYYADYSHGIRLVSQAVWIDGKSRSIFDVLQDTKLARVLCREGKIKNLQHLTGASSRSNSL